MEGHELWLNYVSEGGDFGVVVKLSIIWSTMMEYNNCGYVEYVMC